MSTPPTYAPEGHGPLYLLLYECTIDQELADAAVYHRHSPGGSTVLREMAAVLKV